jgi:hypothetical protein
MPEPQVYVRSRMYEVSVWPEDQADASINADSWRLTVERRGPDRWGIFRGGGSFSMNACGEFSLHSPQDDGHDEWLAAHRFPLEQALEIAREHAPRIRLCGMTAAEVLADERRIGA